MAARTLIRGATVITLDRLGDLPEADILVSGDVIQEIGPRIQADDAEVVSAAGCIVIPGLINAHLHTWQTALRGVAANWTLLEYFQKMHAGLATVFAPEDLHIATLVGALNQLNNGTTTLVDWCHNNRTPAHNDAAIDGLLQSGIRAAFFHGTPKPDPKPGETPFWEVPHPRAEVERLLKAHQGRALLSIGAAVLGPHYSTLEVALHDFRMARDLGVIASLHQGGGPARTPEGWDTLQAEGLLGPHVNIVHGHALSDAQLKTFCDLGMSFSAAAESEMSQGHGHPLTGRLRALATTGAKRDPLLPDLPTVAEAGVTGYESGVWFGLAVAPGTPKEIIAKLNAEAVKGTKAPEYVKRMTELGYNILGTSPEVMAEMTRNEVQRWGPIVKASGAKAD